MSVVPALPRLRALLVGIVAVGLLATSMPSSQAVPADLRRELRQAQARLAELDTAASTAVEDYDEAVLALEEATATLEATRARIAALEVRAAAKQRIANAYASDLYKRGPALQLDAAFGAGGPTEAGVRLATVRRLVQQKGLELTDLANTRVELATSRAGLQEQHDDATTRAAELEANKAAVEALLDRQQDEVAELQERIAELERQAAEERARAAAEARERAVRLQRQREAAAAEARTVDRPAPAPAPPSPAPAPPSNAPPPAEAPEDPPPPASGGSEAGRTAADAAVSQVGKPYRWGGSGPDNYDCSGLTSWAWRKAGKSLPHSSRAQYSATRRISRSQLQPGDLIFYGSPIHHVAMYIGDGKVVEAPYSGKNVRISSTGLSRRDITGYGRP